MPKHLDSITAHDLQRVLGGSRVTARTGGNNDQLMQMFTQITSSIKDLGAGSKSGQDPMQMMMMMMMMGGLGGGGGGGGAAAAPAPAPAPAPAAPLPAQISISVKSV